MHHKVVPGSMTQLRTLCKAFEQFRQTHLSVCMYSMHSRCTTGVVAVRIAVMTRWLIGLRASLPPAFSMNFEIHLGIADACWLTILTQVSRRDCRGWIAGHIPLCAGPHLASTDSGSTVVYHLNQKGRPFTRPLNFTPSSLPGAREVAAGPLKTSVAVFARVVRPQQRVVRPQQRVVRPQRRSAVKLPTAGRI